MQQISYPELADLKKAILRLPKDQLIEIDREIHKHMETSMMMAVAESGFSAWLDPEEDIYDKDV
jgi:hypothetical protein